MSAIVHGGLLLVSVLVLPSVMNLIPLATLAAILLLVGYKLAKPSLFRKMSSEGVAQFVPFIATVVGVVFIDLLVGIGLGLAAAIISLLFENYRIPFEILHLSESGGDKIRIVLAQQVTFLNKASVLKSLNSIPDGETVEIDARDSHYVHADVVEIIDNFVVNAVSRDIEVIVHGLAHHQKGHPAGGAKVTVTLSPNADS